MKIGIIGARLAGSYAALLLARTGHEVIMFDGSAGREKPCGGGVTPKALLTMPWFRENALPHTEIRTLLLTHIDGSCASLQLQPPLHIFSRTVLDNALREAALSAGARFIPRRVREFHSLPRGWNIAGDGHAEEVEFLIGADGAAGMVRGRTAGRFRSPDLSLALGYYMPGSYHQDTVIAEFQEAGFEGYLWSFPRLDHASVGILQSLSSADSRDLKMRVRRFIAARYPGQAESMQFYAARIPCLTAATLLRQRVCGDNWALLGDAAGFADPITAEGIHYALRSAELLAKSFSRNAPAGYEEAWRKDFGQDLLRAAKWHDRFYSGSLLFSAFTRRMIQLTACSSTLRRLSNSVVAGRRRYEQFRRALILASPRVLVEVLAGRRRRISPKGFPG